MAATNAQVQQFVNSDVRPSCSEIVAWVERRENEIATAGDIYANLTATSPPTTWVDSNPNNAPHAMAPGDYVNWNAFMVNLTNIITGSTSDGPTALAMVEAVQSAWPVVKSLPAVPPV